MINYRSSGNLFSAASMIVDWEENMKKVDMIVKAPFFYTMEGEGVGFKSDVAMVVDGSKIIDFVPLKDVDEMYQAEEVLNMDHHAVFPGFID